MHAAEVDTQPDLVVVVDAVAKTFGATRAIRSASLNLSRGEIHALLGENGSGKSTLVKLLGGVITPDEGSISFRTVSEDPHPAALAVATVFQEVLIATGLSVLDNVWLGSDRLLRARLSRRRKRDEAADMLQRLCGRKLDLDAPAGGLALSDQQAVCIARALVRRPRVLLLDEVTSTLDASTRDRLFTMLREEAADGVSIVFISHRMDEILSLADRTTVMRSGVTVATVRRNEANSEGLVVLMTGRERAESSVRRVSEPGEIALSASLSLAPEAEAIELTVRRGEILGIAGLEGHGQSELLLALAGFGHHRDGLVIVDDQHAGESVITSPRKAFAAGICYVPRDRRKASIFASRSIADNFAIATLSYDTKAGIYRPSLSSRRLAHYVTQLRVRMRLPRDPITTLSGGNQQKVVLARWLAASPKVLLLNDPTRGIDLGAKQDIYELLHKLADDGVAIVLASSEIEELLSLSDRVIVMRERTIVKQFNRDSLDEKALVTSFFSGTEPAHA